MLLSNNKYYILRFGDFATDANTKIIYCMFPIVLGIEEYITDNSSYCFRVIAYVSGIWMYSCVCVCVCVCVCFFMLTG